jgi:lipid-binding SYLF domain-containing protein
MIQVRRRRCLALFTGALVASTPATWAAATQDANATVDKARIAFEGLVKSKDYDALRSGLKSAKGVLIFPSIIKGGVIVGGSGGTGVLLVRGEGNSWSQPAFYTLGAVSVGLQIGGQAAEVVILANSQKAVDRLLTNSVKLGGEVSVAAGPQGASKAANLTADFVSYGKSKGAFVGASVEGSVLDVRDSLNHAYYGKTVTPADILVRGSVANKKADALRAAVASAAR